MSDTNMSSDIVERSFKLQMIIMKILGIYPFETYPHFYAFYSNIIYVLFTLLTPVAVVLYLVLNENTSVADIMQSLNMAMQLIILTVKVLPLKNNPQKVKDCMDFLQTLVLRNYWPQQKNIMENCANTTRKMAYGLTFVNTTSCLMWFLQTVMAKQRRTVLRLWLPFDFDITNNMQYFFVIAISHLAILNGALGNAAMHTMIAGLLCHSAGQLKVLKYTLMNLDERTNPNFTDENPEKHDEDSDNGDNVYRRIRECIQHYDSIFEFVKHIEDTYTFVVFSQFLASTIVICISCLQMSKENMTSVAFFNSTIFAIAMLNEIFVFCYYGTTLYEESNTVIHSIYMSKWYTYDKKSKKALLILMERTKRPIFVQAGKMLHLSLDTFSMILRNSYSLLAVLRSTY